MQMFHQRELVRIGSRGSAGMARPLVRARPRAAPPARASGRARLCRRCPSSGAAGACSPTINASRSFKFELLVALGGIEPTRELFNYHPSISPSTTDCCLQMAACPHACLGFGGERVVLALLFSTAASRCCGRGTPSALGLRMNAPTRSRATREQARAAARPGTCVLSRARARQRLRHPARAGREHSVGRGRRVLPAFGWAELCVHRSLRRWAEVLAANGPRGVAARSPGDRRQRAGRTTRRLSAWSEAIAAGGRWLRATQACERVVAIGIGLGGMLALAAIAERAPIDDVVLWGVPGTAACCCASCARSRRCQTTHRCGSGAGSACATETRFEIAGFVSRADGA